MHGVRERFENMTHIASNISFVVAEKQQLSSIINVAELGVILEESYAHSQIRKLGERHKMHIV